MHEELLEVDEGLDGSPSELLHGLGHARHSVDLHGDVDHHVDVEHAFFQDLVKAIFEDWVADVFILQDVAEDEEQWLHVHVPHVARLHFGQEFFDFIVLFKLFEERYLGCWILRADCLEFSRLRKDER